MYNLINLKFRILLVDRTKLNIDLMEAIFKCQRIPELWHPKNRELVLVCSVLTEDVCDWKNFGRVWFIDV